MRRPSRLYHRLLVLYPPAFRSEFEEPMIQMVADRMDAEGSTARLWTNVFADLFRTVVSEHFRTLVGSLRARPFPFWGLLLVVGAVFGGVVAAVGASAGGFARASGGAAESHVWLLVAYAAVLVAFAASFVVRGEKSSQLIKLGIVVFAVGQLSVIAHEAHLLGIAMAVPSMGAASAFPVMVGAGAIAAGMSESVTWSRPQIWATIGVVVFPLVLAFGAYPAVVAATGSEVSADLVFKAGYMATWVLVGATFVLAKPPGPQKET